MKKYQMLPETEYFLVDTRPAEDYRKAHLAQSLNLTLANIETYHQGLISKDQALLWLIASQDDLDTLQTCLQQAQLEDQTIGYMVWADLEDMANETTTTISVQEFFDLQDSPYQLLDVRHPSEITRPAPTKHLVSIPLQGLKDEIDQLQVESPVYTLCGSGNRATTASSLLASKGFKTVVIEGGMKAVQEYQISPQ